MADFIDRQATLNVSGLTTDATNFNPTKYVDAQGNELVAVVHCKDCKYYEEYEEGKYWCWVGILGAAKPTDFCSYGKRREDAYRSEE